MCPSVDGPILSASSWSRWRFAATATEPTPSAEVNFVISVGVATSPEPEDTLGAVPASVTGRDATATGVLTRHKAAGGVGSDVHDLDPLGNYRSVYRRDTAS